MKFDKYITQRVACRQIIFFGFEGKPKDLTTSIIHFGNWTCALNKILMPNVNLLQKVFYLHYVNIHL